MRSFAEQATFRFSIHQYCSPLQDRNEVYASIGKHVFWSDLRSRNVPFNNLRYKAGNLDSLRHVDAAATTTKHKRRTDLRRTFHSDK
jgi:hypothetical protein